MAGTTARRDMSGSTGSLARAYERRAPTAGVDVDDWSAHVLGAWGEAVVAGARAVLAGRHRASPTTVRPTSAGFTYGRPAKPTAESFCGTATPPHPTPFPCL